MGAEAVHKTTAAGYRIKPKKWKIEWDSAADITYRGQTNTPTGDFFRKIKPAEKVLKATGKKKCN